MNRASAMGRHPSQGGKENTRGPRKRVRKKVRGKLPIKKKESSRRRGNEGSKERDQGGKEASRRRK